MLISERVPGRILGGGVWKERRGICLILTRGDGDAFDIKHSSQAEKTCMLCRHSFLTTATTTTTTKSTQETYFTKTKTKRTTTYF